MFSGGAERHQRLEMGYCVTLNMDLLAEKEI